MADMNSETVGEVPSLAACLAAASDTKALLVREGALESLSELIKLHFPDSEVFLVADGNTMEAAGDRALAAVRDAGLTIAGNYCFPASPRLHADYGHVATLASAFRDKGAERLLPVAVGAGTLNDLVKRAAHEIDRPYLCLPTAASVDGYTSYGAALLSDGYKRTLECAAPRVVVADSAVLSRAPAYLSSSGFGDLASKIVAGTDWIIAEVAGRAGAPGTEPIDAFAWDMTQTGLRSALERSESAAKGDAEAVGTLFEALALTGFSMQYLKSSRPVSGCEHLFSHVWEMSDLSVGGLPVTHGHKVAVGTLCATALTETVFSRREPPAAVSRSSSLRAARDAEARSAFAGLPAVEAVVETVLAKLLDDAAAANLVAALADNWSDLRSRVLDRLMPYDELLAMLERAGCPTKPEEIGLTRKEAIATARKAQMIRNRYTALDLAWDMGILDSSLADLERNQKYLR